MKTVSRPNLERENPAICEKSGGDAVKLKTFLITASLWMGLLGLTACGGADVRTYQYPETALLFDSLHIKKTVYSPGIMELYYRGGQFKDNPIRCYDANFEDLGDQFDHTFQNGVLTVQADFAEQISGLTIEDKDHDTVYHLRYLDSPQFAWLADTFWLDYGMMTLGDEARYYSDAERQEQAEWERTEHACILIAPSGYASHRSDPAGTGAFSDSRPELLRTERTDPAVQRPCGSHPRDPAAGTCPAIPLRGPAP